MAVTYSAAVKTSRMTATRDYLANGTLEILTSGDALLATFGLSASGGTISGSDWVLELDATTVTASGNGTAAKAQIKTSGGSAHITGLTVGLAGATPDLVLDNTSILTGQSVSLTGTNKITHA
jgi:hypothetical protein